MSSNSLTRAENVLNKIKMVFAHHQMDIPSELLVLQKILLVVQIIRKLVKKSKLKHILYTLHT